MSLAEDWWAAQDELPFDEPGACGEYLSPNWWRRPWPVYRESADAVTLPDIGEWQAA